MKRLPAWILSLSLLFALALPTAAGEVEDLPLSVETWNDAKQQPYWVGYDAGYDVGYGEGYAQGHADGDTEYVDNPYKDNLGYDLLDYQAGYQYGLYSGFSDGSYTGWRDKMPYYQQYDLGDEEGFDAGCADGFSWYPDESKLESLEWPEEDDSDLQNGPQGYADGYQNGYHSGCFTGFYQAAEEEASRQAQLTREQAIAEAGGKVGGINVMVNGSCLDLADATPQIKNGRTMVPLRGVMEALGAEVAYENDKITVTWNGAVMTTTVGTKVVSVRRDNDTTPVTMDCASYVDGDRAYVPIRFLSEAAGYDVLWDSGYQTVVLLDPKTITADLNAEFQIINLILAAQKTQREEPYQTTTDLTAKAEIIDTIDGNKTAAITGRSVAQIQGMTMNMTGELDLTQLWDMLEDSAPALRIPQETEARWKEEFSKVTLAVKINEDGAYYVRCPLLVKILLPQDLAPTDPNAWIRLLQVDPTLLEGTLTLGDILYGTVLAQSNEYGYGEPFLLYEQMQQAKDHVKKLIGDKTFTRSGNAYQWSFGLEELVRYLEPDEEDQAALEGILRQFTVGLSFQTNGNYTVQGEIKVGLPGLGALLRAAFQESGSAHESTGNGQLQIRNLLNVTLTTTTKRQKINQPPDTGFSPGDQVVDQIIALF